MKTQYIQKSGLAILVASIFLIVSCDSSTKYRASYSHDIQPIFNTKCLDCHGNAGQSNLELTSYEKTMSGGSINGPIVVPGNADGSLLYEAVSKPDNEQSRINNRMPRGRDPLTVTQIQLIEDWIIEGAKDN
ncbi:MAG: c-type cytochrome domain-containing protein [Candidatus Neomarinimicrobiota bacterium]